MSEPLTHPDCDLRGMPFMPLDVVRLIDSDMFALSTGDEFKAAVALWCKSWNQVPAASVPCDDRILARLAGLSFREWSAVKAMALRGWLLCDDGRLYHPVVAQKAGEAWAARGRQRDRANRRWAKVRGEVPPDGTGPDTGNAPEQAAEDAPAHATAYPTAMQGTGTGTGILAAAAERVREPDENWPGGGAGEWQSALSALAGPGLADPAKEPSLTLTSAELVRWRDAGCSWAQDVVPAVRARTMKARASPIRTWPLLTPDVLANRDRRLSPLPGPQEVHSHERSEPPRSAFTANNDRAFAGAEAALARRRAERGE